MKARTNSITKAEAHSYDVFDRGLGYSKVVLPDIVNGVPSFFNNSGHRNNELSPRLLFQTNIAMDLSGFQLILSINECGSSWRIRGSVDYK